MKYIARIRNNATGEVRSYNPDMDWNNPLVYWWTEGNFGCDCNRSLSWLRAGGLDEDEVERLESPCGETAFTVIDVTLADGTVIPIDTDPNYGRDAKPQQQPLCDHKWVIEPTGGWHCEKCNEFDHRLEKGGPP